MTNPKNLSDNSLFYPLTEAQKGIWVGQQLNPKSPMYNTAEYIEFSAGLKENLFEIAVKKALIEYEALHVIFFERNGQPYQSKSEVNSLFEVKDFSGSKPPKIEAKKWMETHLKIPFDLRKGPLFSSVLLKLGEGKFYWFLKIHHIACDGYSYALVTQRIAGLYNSLIQNPNENLEIIGNRFGNYSTLLETDFKYFKSPYLKKDKEFWINLLKNQEENSSFLKSSNGIIANRSIKNESLISTELLVKINAFSRDVNVTWADFLIGACIAFLYNRTGNKDLTIGIPVMGRMGTPTIRIPGMVMNIVPLRVILSKETSFRDLIIQISNQLKKGRPHHRYRYEHLKRDLSNKTGNYKLFNAVVNILPFDRNLNFNSCQVKAHGLSAGPVENLSFGFVYQENGSLNFNLEANPNAYQPADLKEYKKDFHKLLLELIVNQDKKLEANLKFLSYLKGVGHSSKTKEQGSIHVLQRIGQHFKKRKNKIAITCGGNNWTYEKLEKQTFKIANFLFEKGIKKDSVVVLFLNRGEWTIATILAISSLEATFVCLDPKSPQKRNYKILEDVKPHLIIGERQEENYLRFPIISLNQIKEKVLGTRFIDYGKLSDDQLAYIIYTSGSTGSPKGVMIGQKALNNFIESAIEGYGFKPDDRVLQFAPLHFDTCIEEIFGTLCAGGTLVIRNDEMLNSIEQFLKQCSQWNITVLDLPTAYWHEIAYAVTKNTYNLPNGLKTIIIGGEAVLEERVYHWINKFGDKVKLINSYGPSEGTVVATISNLTKSNKLNTIGLPLDGRSIVVVNDKFEILRRGLEGELILLGNGLFNGYLNLPEETQQAFVKINIDGLDIEATGYRTGDRAKINEDGNIEFIGRIDDQIKISGQRIEALEIENTIVSLEGVNQAVVNAEDRGSGIKTLTAIIEISEGMKGKKYSDISILRKELAEKLPLSMLPSNVVVIDKLPINSSGKIDRKKIGELNITLSNKDHISLTPTQKIISAIWEEVLGKSNFKIGDNFFLIGGQSLQIIQVANRLSKEFGIEISVPMVFQFPTLERLALELDLVINKGSENSNMPKEDELSAFNLMEADCDNFQNEYQSLVNDNSTENSRVGSAIFLTGSTGFVGSHLLFEILKQSSEKIYCLVRSGTKKQGLEKLQDSFCAYNLNPDQLNRVEIIPGDLEKPNLGLSNSEASLLFENIGLIIHNAAVTSVMRDYKSLRKVNAISTSTLLKLSSKFKTPFHLISTIAVAPSSGKSARLKEEFIDMHHGLLDGYQQSKWVSEKMVEVATKNGLQANVYRLGRVTGSTVTGYVNKNDLVWRILRAGLNHNLLPNLSISEPWTPVDYLAKFIVKHILSTSLGETLNIVPKKYVVLSEIYDWLRTLDFNFKVLPLNEWCNYINEKGQNEDLAILGFFEQRKNMSKDGNKLEIAPIEFNKFLRSSKKLDFQLPEIPHSLFKKYLNFSVCNGLISRKLPKEKEENLIY